MSWRLYAISLLAFLAMLATALAPAALHANVLNDSKEKNHANDAPDDDLPGDDNETSSVPSIGGGGWFTVKAGSMTYKDTFGMFISGNSSVPSEFVLQGRDASVRIHSVNFTKTTFANNNTTVNAKGWCTVNGANGYWFNLTASDMGNRSSDMLMLSVYKDVNNTGDMNETTPAWQWTANGLGGGQIWSSSMQEVREDIDDDNDESASEDVQINSRSVHSPPLL